MPYVTIDVLQDDIERALRDRRYRAPPATFCPIARAVCRALGLTLGSVQVRGNSISIWDWQDHEYLCVAATKKLGPAVTGFGRDKNIQPTTFRIDLKPLPVQRE